MIQNPQELYDPNDINSTEVKPPKVKKGGSSLPDYLAWRSNAGQNMSRAGSSFKVNGVDNGDQEKFFGDTGIADPYLTGQDIALEAGNRQSFGNKLARRTANLIPNMAAGIIDMVGNVGSLLTEWGDERDYHNALNDIADSIKDPAGKLYHRSTDTWAISDPTWWIDHIGGFVEMAGTFAIGGAGAAKVLGGAAKLATGVNDLAQASKWVQAGTQLANSSLMSYVMGAQGGAHVYQEVYGNQYNKFLADGLSPEDAHTQATHIAAQSAASTAQLTTMLTMGMNVGAFAPYFKSQQRAVEDIIGKNIAGMENATAVDIASGIRGMNAADYADKLFHNKSILAKLAEMGKIGTEMTLIKFAEKTGTDLGNKGETKGFITQLGEVSNMLDRVGNSEGLLSFVMGAAMGGLQHYFTNNIIPSRSVEKFAEDGTPLQRFDKNNEPMVDKTTGQPVVQKTWVTPRTYERDFTKRRFDSIKDAVARDFENFSEANDDIITAVKAGKSLEADQARDRLFDTGRMYAVKAGITEPWKRTFDKIANMDPQAAIEAGYATDINDLSYKERANKASADMDHFSKVYNNLKKRYGTSEAIDPFIDMAFARHVDIYSTGERIKEYKQNLERSEAEENELAQVTGPVNDLISNYLKQHNSATEVERQLVEDHAILLGKDPVKIARILKKYRAIGYGDNNNTVVSIADLDKKLRTKQQEVTSRLKNAESAMLNSEEYTKWLDKHPGSKFDDFLKEANQRSNLSIENRARRAELEIAEAQHAIAKENLEDMVSERSAKKFSRKASEWMESMKKEAEAAEEQRMTKLAEMVKDKAALDRLEKIQLNSIAEDYRNRRDGVYKSILDNNKRIEGLKLQLEKQSRWDPVKTVGLNKQIKQLREHNKTLDINARKYDSLFNEYKVDTASTDELIAVEDLTGEADGKVTESANEYPTTATVNTGTGVEVINDSVPAELPVELPAIEQKELFTNDPVSNYAKLYSSVPAVIKGRLTRLVNDAMDKGTDVSYDSLNSMVKSGKLTQEKAAQLIDALNDYVRELNAVKAQQEVEQFNEIQPVIKPKDIVQVTGVEAPETPEINSNPETEYVPENDAYTSGYKIVDAANTGATLTQGYDEGIRKDKDGKLVYFRVTKPNALNKELNEDILKPNALKVNHPIRFEIDLDYEGPKILNDSLSWDSNNDVVTEHESGMDYVGKDGKVTSSGINNVPIKVVDAITGKHLFYVRKMDWVTAKLPGSKNYRNVAEQVRIPGIEEPVDNISLQIEQLADLRKRIVDKWNIEGKHTEGVLGSKGTGRLILNYQTTKGTGTGMSSEVQSELAYNKSNPDKSMLPDSKLQIAIVDAGGIITTAIKYEFTGKLGFNTKGMVKGSVGALVKAANGDHMFAPLVGMKIIEPGKPSPGLNSIKRAIELYLLNDGTDKQIGAEIDNLQSNTGFNVGTSQGLKAFINQYYTYTQGFMDSALSPNNDTGLKDERFLFSIDTKGDNIQDKTKQIKVGFSMRGDGVVYANLENGTLSQGFTERLIEGLQLRSRAVVYTNAKLGLKGINSIGSFKDAIYVPGKGWKHDSYTDYNEYVKSFSRTPVYGRNQLSDGTYVYTANPHLPIEISKVVEETNVISEPNTSVETVKLPDKNIQPQTFDDLFEPNFKLPVQKTVQEMGTGSNKSRALTIDTLEKMYNFTPEVQRNGKTVLEVFEELKSRGHTYLSDGFNPFSRCL